AQGGIHTSEIHVPYSGPRVPGPLAHLREPRRVEGPLIERSSHNGVKANVRQEHSVVQPRLTAVIGVDDLRCSICKLGGKPSAERVRGLHQVVIYRDDGVPPLTPWRVWQECYRPPTSWRGRCDLQISSQVGLEWDLPNSHRMALLVLAVVATELRGLT